MGKSIVFTDEQEEFMIYNYTALKRGVNAIGKDLGVSGITIQRHLKKMGVKIRTLQEAVQDCRSYNVNDNFFKTQSHDMAYILGLLASDGCVSKNTNHLRIDLSVMDEEILYKIKEVFDFEGAVGRYTNNSGHEYSQLRVCSPTMKKDLAHYGIIPAKTYTLQPPLFLEEKYWIDYIRGYFDGDGCIFINYEKYKYDWYICGAKKDVLEWMQSVLLNQYGIQTYLHRTAEVLKNGDYFYSIHVYKKTDIIKLFNILYVPNSLFLQRKYELMKNFYDIKSKRLYSLSDKEKRYAELVLNEEQEPKDKKPLG